MRFRVLQRLRNFSFKSLIFTLLILEGARFSVSAWNGDKIPKTAKRQQHSEAMDMRLPPDAQIRRDQGRGTITFLRAKNLSERLEQDSHFRKLQSANRFADIVLAFLSAYRVQFKLKGPAKEMFVQSVVTDDYGFKHIRLQQVFAGIPVWGAELMAHLDQANHVYLFQGRYIPTPSRLPVTPRMSAKEALEIVATQLTGVGSECHGCRSELVIFVTAENEPRLAYRVLANVSLIEGWAFVVDAKTGSVLEKVTTVYTKGF